MIKVRASGKTQEQAAAHAGMSTRTVRKYEQAGILPSELRRPCHYQTWPNPFADAGRGCKRSWRATRPSRRRRCSRCSAASIGTVPGDPATHAAAAHRQLAGRTRPDQEVMLSQVHRPGVVESLVTWVKGNFLLGRSFADDADLAE